VWTPARASDRLRPVCVPGRAPPPVSTLRHLRRSFAGWRRHRFNIRDMGALRGETIIEPK